MNEAEAKRLIDTYADLILRISISYLKSADDAEDICQMVFLKYLTARKVFDTPEHEKAWIIRTSINSCKDHLKSAFIKRCIHMDENFDVPDRTDDNTYTELKYLIDRLPHMQGLSIYLHYYEGYSIREIAKILNKRESAVAAYLSRGRRNLKEYLTQAESLTSAYGRRMYQ